MLPSSSRFNSLYSDYLANFLVYFFFYFASSSSQFIFFAEIKLLREKRKKYKEERGKGDEKTEGEEREVKKGGTGISRENDIPLP